MRKSSILKRLFHWYFLLRRPMTLGVRVAAFNERGEVLLVRHTYVSGWHFPGGGVERGETLQDAAEKELREETGVVLSVPLRLVSVHYNREASPRDHVVLFECKVQSAPEAFEPNREIAEAGFFPVTALPDETTTSTRARIKEILQAHPAPPDW